MMDDALSRRDGEKAAMRSALAHAVGTLCERERGRGLEMEPTAVATLAYAVEHYLKTLAVDLPAFAKHAKRNTVHVDDVLLAARGSPELRKKLEDFIEANDLRPHPKKKRNIDTS
ncbi:hypothetical protein CTAYLR_006984 [Chrysophaeum taylorii]|uniref:Centromere protein S n=1 Tax=Chrysophaeum taylorii TaxID=2483200 RepID=A0AAD7U9R1_9STRA|nr:hypothetical protein CTAYLR_006984 [Chrysophaeum taylorii]